MPRWPAERPWRAVVLITGASSGLGAGLAERFALDGHRVALCARRLDDLAATRSRILARAPAADVRVRPLDVDNPPR